MTRLHLITSALVAALGIAAAGCSSTAAPSSTTTTTIVSTQAEAFTGSLDRQGSSFYSFNVTTAGNVGVTLASLTTGTPGPAVGTVMGIGIGVPSGTDCAVTDSLNVAPALTVQLTVSKAVGTYCVRVFDIGNLTGPVNFGVRIVHS